MTEVCTQESLQLFICSRLHISIWAAVICYSINTWAALYLKQLNHLDRHHENHAVTNQLKVCDKVLNFKLIKKGWDVELHQMCMDK